MSVPDVIVVGAGIVGAAIARELSMAGQKVLVLDRAFVGGGATAAGMGHIVVMDDSDAQLALTIGSRALLEEVAADMPADCERETCGTLWIAENGAQQDELHRKQARHAALGVRCDLLDAQSLAEAEPQLRPGLTGALRVPDDGVVYPPAVARWLMDRALEHGATLRQYVHVRRITDEGVETDHGVLQAGRVINAAGAHAPLLCDGIDIVPRKGHLLITDRYPSFCRHQLVELGYLASAHTLNAESIAFNVQPRRTGQMLIGSSRELVGWDSNVNRGIVERMLARAVSFLPRLETVKVLRTWTGFRPSTPRHLPFIGRAPGLANGWIAAGHEGLGITTALGTARLLGDLVLGRTPFIDPTPYAP